MSQNFRTFCPVDPKERNTWRSGLRSAMRAASQLPGKGSTDVGDAPAHACKSKILSWWWLLYWKIVSKGHNSRNIYLTLACWWYMCIYTWYYRFQWSLLEIQPAENSCGHQVLSYLSTEDLSKGLMQLKFSTIPCCRYAHLFLILRVPMKFHQNQVKSCWALLQRIRHRETLRNKPATICFPFWKHTNSSLTNSKPGSPWEGFYSR